MLGEVDWPELKRICDEVNDLDDSLFKYLFVLTVLQVTLPHTPPKRRGDGNAQKKKRDMNSLKMKRRKLNSKIRKLEQENPSSLLIPNLHTEISLRSYAIKDEILAYLNERESYAVCTININPNTFQLRKELFKVQIQHCFP